MIKISELHDAWRQLPLTTPRAFTGGQPFVVLSPHPDDETLGTGGLIAAACEDGQDVRVVIVTDGAGSHPGSRLYPAERLVALRKAESAAAAERLGLDASRLSHLDLPDTRAPSAGPVFEAAVDHIAAVIQDVGARLVLVTWRQDPHCDHEAVAAMARAVRAADPGLMLWSYPIWGWHRPADDVVDEPRPEGFRLDITPWLARKQAAVAAHVSQMTGLISDDPEGFCFTDKTVAPFLQPVETVFRVPA